MQHLIFTHPDSPETRAIAPKDMTAGELQTMLNIAFELCECDNCKRVLDILLQAYEARNTVMFSFAIVALGFDVEVDFDND